MLNQRSRHDRTCRTWEIDSRKSHLGSHDRPIQKRARTEHHYQTWLCQRQGAYPPPFFFFTVPYPPVFVQHSAFDLGRYINAKTKHARDQVATGHIVPTRRTTRLANDLVVATA